MDKQYIKEIMVFY